MINFKVIIDSAGNTDRKTLGTIKQYSVNAYDIYFYIPDEWEGYSFTSSIKRNDGTAITALLPLTTGSDNEGNYVLLNLTEWISDYKGEVKIQIFATYNGKTYSSSIVKLIVEEGVMPSNWTPSDVPNPYQAVLDYVNTQLALKVNKTFTIRTGTSSGNTFAMTGTEILLTTNFTPYASIANIVAGETIEVMMSKISKWFSSFADVVFTGDYSDLANLPDLGDLAYLDSITSEYLPSGTVIDSSYVHTDNNFTSNLKTRLEGIEEGAQVNIIEGVSVNSTPLTPVAKVVNIVVPTKTSDLTNDSNFVKTSDVNKLIKSMELSQVESTGVITITWTCYDNTTGSTSIDLAIEQIIDPDTTYYNNETKSLVLGFVGGGSVIIPIGDLVDLYYADEITLTQYLDVDSKYKFKIKDSWISANVTTKLDKTGDSLNNVVTFTIAATRENINTGESHATLFGKIKKWFGDLKALAFKDAVTSAEMPSDTVFDSSYVHTDNNLTDSIVSDITSNTSSRHTHTNKTLLDGFTGLRTTIRASASASDTELVSEKATSTELELKEVLANKITAIRDSETATNVKYPSELAVRTLFDTGLIYSEDLIAINYPTDEQIAENPTYYQGVLPSVYMVLSWFNDKLAAAGYGDMLKSTFATNAKVAQGYVDKAIMADSATSADDSVLLGGQLPSYYLNYNNLTNTPDYGDMFKSVFATNAKVAQGYVDKAILADDSVELGGQLPSYYLNYNNLTNTPSSLKNPYSLTFGAETYDGSSAKTITKSDLGLGNVINPTTYGGIAISEDFNAITFGGLYTGFGTATGAPESSYSWFVFHQNSNVGTVSASQIAIAYSSTTPLIYSRIKMTTWGSWKKIITTDDLEDAVGTVYTTILTQFASLKGANNGLAELDSSGKVPSSQLPSYIDDVLEYDNLASFPETGEDGKIYIAKDTNLQYRWSGSAYVEISPSLALGETSSTAYRGDKGKTAYDHSQINDGSNPHNTTFANIASKPTTLSGYGITDASLKNPYSLTFGAETYDGSSAKTITKSDLGLGNVDNIKQMPISDGVLENYREKLVTLSGTSTAINLSLGNVFTHTLSGNTTYTISNAVNGQAHSFTLIVTMGSTVRTLTFPASVKWQGGEIPDLTTASKTYVLTFMSVDGGSNWLGMFGGEF